MGSPVYYTYKLALDRVEKFMKDSGIRRYCEVYCRGYCCGGCYEQDTACHKNEGRRLACSHFMCFELRQLVFTNRAALDRYEQLGQLIRRALSEYAYRSYYVNPYFTPYTKAQMKAFRLLKSHFDDNLPNKAETSAICYKIDALCTLLRHARYKKQCPTK